MSLNSKEVIRVADLEKSYKIFKRKRDRFKSYLFRNKDKYYCEKIALDKINLSINKGEIVGIIGRNGAGKSTLLQVICGTIRQSKGTIETKGKIAALLELGSGFNPEFTGRENVVINGMIMGMKKKRIMEKMQDIIKFAELEEYIDQPVKVYSSGMIVRLAFAIIAYIEADILIIDEALAVGDVFFTQKCMRFIRRFKQNGTILLVSHDENAILSICDKAVLLENGRLVAEGSPKKIIEKYNERLRNKSQKNSEDKIKDESPKKQEIDSKVEEVIQSEDTVYDRKWKDYRHESIESVEETYRMRVKKFGNYQDIMENKDRGKCIVTDVRVTNYRNDASDDQFVMGGDLITLQIKCLSKAKINKMIVGFLLKNEKGLVLLGDNTLNMNDMKTEIAVKKGDVVKVEFTFVLPMLPAGKYSITSSIAEGSLEEHNILNWINDSLILTSQCTNICAGLAGIPMKSIKVIYED